MSIAEPAVGMRVLAPMDWDIEDGHLLGATYRAGTITAIPSGNPVVEGALHSTELVDVRLDRGADTVTVQSSYLVAL